MLNKKIKISQDVLSQEVSGETVLLDLKNESYFGLDEVGTRIWQLIQEKSEVDSVVEEMLKEYDVEEKLLRQDIEKLIKMLIDEGLLELENWLLV